MVELHCPVLPLFHVPSHSFQEYLILNISQQKDVADRSVFFLIVLHNLLKNGSDIAFFFQPLGTSPDRHDFSNTIRNGLATTPATSFRTLGCSSPGPIDVWTFTFSCGRKTDLHLQWEGHWSSSPHLPIQSAGRLTVAQFVAVIHNNSRIRISPLTALIAFPSLILECAIWDFRRLPP